MPVGIFADWLIAKEYFSLRNIRRICNSIGFFGPAIGLVFLSFAGCDRTQAIVWLCASVALNGAVYSGFQVILYTYINLHINKKKSNGNSKIFLVLFLTGQSYGIISKLCWYTFWNYKYGC